VTCSAAQEAIFNDGNGIYHLYDQRHRGRGSRTALLCAHIQIRKKSEAARAECWRDQGGVAQETMFDVELLRSGDTTLDVEELLEDLYRVKYHYSVRGMTYTVSLRFLSDYPTKITVYYDPENHIAANEISEAARRRRSWGLCIFLTLLSIAVSGSILQRLFLR